MFRGAYPISVDAKGRMAMPAKHRERLDALCNGQLIATIDTHSPCLLIYPLPTWELIEQKLQSLPSFDERARTVQRLMIGNATEMDLDSSGRVLLPANLRAFANLDKRVVLVGQANKFELWSEDNWMAATNKGLADVRSGDLPMPGELLNLSL